MAFKKKTWKDRLVEHAGRRSLKRVSGSADSTMVVDVTRSEGTVSQSGDAFSAANMNDLEQRILDGFTDVNNDLTRQPQFIYDTAGKITGYKTQAGADTVFPFSSVKFYTPKLILGGYDAYKLGNFCFPLKNVNKIKFTVSDILTSSGSATWQYTDGNITKIITKGNTYEYIVSNDTLEFMIKGISTVYSLLTLTNFEIS